MREFESTLGREAVATFVVRVAWVGLEFLTSIALARLLGLPAYGAYALAMSVVAVVSGTASLGFDRLLVREVAMYRARANWGRLRGLLRLGNFASLVWASVLALAMAAAAPWLGARSSSDALGTIRLAALLVPVMALSRQRQAALQGLGKVALGQSPEALLQPLVVLLLVGVNLALAFAPWSGTLAIAAQVFAAFAAAVAGSFLLRRALPHPARIASPEYATREWLAAAAPMLSLVLATLALNNVDTILLGVLQHPEQAGSYRAASQIAALVVFPMTAINMAAAPRLASLHAAGDRAAMQRIATRAVRSGTSIGLALALVLWIFGHQLLGLFGPGFERAYLPLMVLTGAYVFNTMAGTAGYMLLMTHHSRLAAGLFFASLVPGVAVQLWLIPGSGSVGAAIGTALSLVLLSGALVVAARRLTGMRAGVWSR